MKQKLLAYALFPSLLGAAFLGVNTASAQGFFGGTGNLSNDEIASRQQEMFSNQARILGISINEIKEAWAQGKSMKEIMEEKNISEEEIQARVREMRLEELKNQLAALVSKGVITQAQADKRLETMQNRIENQGRRGIGKGFFRGFRF